MKSINSLHLKLLHKHIKSKKSDKNVHESNEPISTDELSDSNNKSASDQNENKIFKCELCQYFSFKRGHLKVHITSIHEGKKPFKCEFCDKAFSQKSKMKIHIASIHEGKKPFKCEFCNNAFSRKNILKKHITIHERNKAF